MIEIIVALAGMCVRRDTHAAMAPVWTIVAIRITVEAAAAFVGTRSVMTDSVAVMGPVWIWRRTPTTAEVVEMFAPISAVPRAFAPASFPAIQIIAGAAATPVSLL